MCKMYVKVEPFLPPICCKDTLFRVCRNCAECNSKVGLKVNCGKKGSRKLTLLELLFGTPGVKPLLTFSQWSNFIVVHLDISRCIGKELPFIQKVIESVGWKIVDEAKIIKKSVLI